MSTFKMMQKKWPTCDLCLNWRMLCWKEVETQEHILVHCLFTSCLCLRNLEEMSLVWAVPRSSHELFVVDLGCDLGRRGIIFWTAVVHCICWLILLERNRNIFDNLEESVEECCDKIKIRAFGCRLDWEAYRV